MSKPQWWPNGADETKVRDCNCDYCTELIEALEQHQNGVAVTGEDATLSRYADT